MYIQFNATGRPTIVGTGFTTASSFHIRITTELLLIVTATDKETYASLSIIISCHLSRPTAFKISYLLGYYSTSMALGYLLA